MVRSTSSILVVDGLSETTEVLKAVLEPRGHAVCRLRQSQLSDQPKPNLVIWHDDNVGQDSSANAFPDVPRIVIGKTQIVASTADAPRFSPPFQYGELLQAIESLLASENSAA